MADNSEEPTVIPIIASCRKDHEWEADYQFPGFLPRVTPEKCPICGLRYDSVTRRKV